MNQLLDIASDVWAAAVVTLTAFQIERSTIIAETRTLPTQCAPVIINARNN